MNGARGGSKKGREANAYKHGMRSAVAERMALKKRRALGFDLSGAINSVSDFSAYRSMTTDGGIGA